MAAWRIGRGCGGVLMKLGRLGSIGCLWCLGALVACAPTVKPAVPANGPSAAAPRQPGPTLVAAIRLEPLTLATRPLREQGVAVYLSGRMFNAELAILDDKANPRPYLAEGLPRLGTDDWRVFPDGTMETSYQLKPNLTWQDGTPLTAEDFVFGWHVYSTPELGARGNPYSAMAQVSAPDARTINIRWHRPYPDAGSFTNRNGELPPLPRHILQAAFDAGSPETFASHPYWTTEYVGLGPYQLSEWQLGSFVEGTAFAGHILGRPKIDRVRLVFISDSNTTLANLLAGEVHLSADSSLRVAQVPTLKNEWGQNGGTIVLHPNQWRSVSFQFRPDLADPAALLDVRVRRALAHAIDKAPINEAVYDGNSVPAEIMIPPVSELGRAVDGAIVKYAYDLRQSEQLMREAGYIKGANNFYASPNSGQFTAEIKTNAAADNEAEMSALVSGWRQAGFDTQSSVLPAAQARDSQVRASFPAMFSNNTTVGLPSLTNQTSAKIPRPENRWQGGNRGGWSNAEYDRLVDAFDTELDRGRQIQLLTQATRLYSEQVPTISLFFRTQPWAYLARLRGPALVAPEANVAWDIGEWEFQ